MDWVHPSSIPIAIVRRTGGLSDDKLVEEKLELSGVDFRTLAQL